MKLNRLETHDRLQHFVKDQAKSIFEGAETCLKVNTDSLAIQEKCPYVYIFAHPRTADDGVSKRMLWQPRLTKPLAQTNSYLFRAVSKTDVLEICWLLPPEETWAQYRIGNVTQNEFVLWSIDQYKHNRKDLEAKDPHDLDDEQCKNIFLQILQEKKQDKMMQAIYDISI